MQSEYIEQRNGGYYLTGARVSLDSIVCTFNEGLSPDPIREEFPTLKLAQIYGAIAFYLDHQAEIDKYLEESEREFEMGSIPLVEENPELWARLQHARATMGRTRS